MSTDTIDWETLAKSSKPRRTMGKIKMAVRRDSLLKGRAQYG
jgi:hypothetical protein